MGNALARELATSLLGLRQALSIHLTSNHHPPVPAEMIEPCVLAIEAMNDGDMDADILLPMNTYWRGQLSAPAWAIVEGHHLESWLSQDGE